MIRARYRAPLPSPRYATVYFLIGIYSVSRLSPVELHVAKSRILRSPAANNSVKQTIVRFCNIHSRLIAQKSGDFRLIAVLWGPDFYAAVVLHPLFVRPGSFRSLKFFVLRRLAAGRSGISGILHLRSVHIKILPICAALPDVSHPSLTYLINLR